MPIIYPDLRLDYKVATHPRFNLEVVFARFECPNDIDRMVVHRRVGAF